MVANQTTIKNPFNLKGPEALGGKNIKAFFEGAPENNGIRFQTPSGDIQVSLENTRAKRALFDVGRMAELSNGIHAVLIPEHSVGTLYGLGVDNANIRLETEGSKSYNILKHILGSSNTYVVPDLGQTLYDNLRNNTIQQRAHRKTLSLEEKIESKKLSIEPIEREDIIIDIETKYKLKSGEVVIQSYKGTVTPELTGEISTARTYCRVPWWSPRALTKFVSCFFYLSQGFGNGSSKDTVFYPVKNAKEWYDQENMEAEIVKHSILDKLGEIALLPGRLSGVKITSRGAGHEYTLDFLRKYQDKFKIIET